MSHFLDFNILLSDGYRCRPWIGRQHSLVYPRIDSLKSNTCKVYGKIGIINIVMKLKFPYDTVETEDKRNGYVFTEGSWSVCFGPLLVEQLLAVLVGMADVVMVAAVGETAVSGVALVDSISVLVIQVLSAMATGGSGGLLLNT